MPNLLAGSGPQPAGPVQTDGPPSAIQGSTGAAPQAPPQQNPGVNMLAGGGAAPAGQEAPVPPTKEQLVDVAHRTGYVNSMLGSLINKPKLSTRDVIDNVGTLVAEQIMDPFMAAKYLNDLPTDTPQIRQWVAQHYVKSKQTLQTVAEMLHAHGAMTRAGQAPQPATGPQGAPAPQNAMSPAPSAPAAPGPQNALAGS